MIPHLVDQLGTVFELLKTAGGKKGPYSIVPSSQLQCRGRNKNFKILLPYVKLVFERFQLPLIYL